MTEIEAAHHHTPLPANKTMKNIDLDANCIACPKHRRGDDAVIPRVNRLNQDASMVYLKVPIWIIATALSGGTALSTSDKPH